jgi:tetratricopeptide (TPR) repeat protein
MEKNELEKRIKEILTKKNNSEKIPLIERMIGYSEQIIERKGLLAEETIKNLYELCADLYLEVKTYNFAAINYKRSGLEDKSKEMWKKYAEENKYKAEVEHWHELFSEAARSYENAGLVNESKQMWKEYAKDCEARFRWESAGNAYKKADLVDEAKKMFNNAGWNFLKEKSYDYSIASFKESGLNHDEIHELIIPHIKEQDKNYPYLKLFDRLEKVYINLGLNDKAEEVINLQNNCQK